MVSDLQQTQRRLNDLQTQYERYADADMPALERDINALPQWREQRDQLRTHLNVMQDAVKRARHVWTGDCVNCPKRWPAKPAKPKN
ncbi:hypothetical protein HSBAA_09760 [Vreelandella sulfidaeris]|uniref:Uncharacterized protein n=1 Tax=Vreelandella sulfidaeris TaxID=115553 RepID=A0A455U122_9GAMM|nr:hypothetical protein HSBAA_09760 [Halomonas sulfidaeris]